MGYMVAMDENGDAEGNYTIVARTRESEEEDYGLHPIGVFLMPLNSTRIPVCITIYNLRYLPEQACRRFSAARFMAGH